MTNAIKKVVGANGIFPYVENMNPSDYPSVDWEHDPDVSGVSGVSRDYWKYDGTNVVVEMSQAEKDAIEGIVKVKIFRYIDEGHDDKFEPPLGHNYVSGLSIKLYPERLFSNDGVLHTVNWYADEAFTDLILKSEMVYVRDADDIAQRRTTTRTWICENESEHAIQKISEKVYSDEEALDEGVRKRQNVINMIQIPIIGMIMATESIAQSAALDIGNVFLEDYAVELNSFIQTPRQNALSTRLIAETGYAWLDNVAIPPSTTIRDYILSRVT